jgi:hypothetical protein
MRTTITSVIFSRGIEIGAFFFAGLRNGGLVRFDVLSRASRPVRLDCAGSPGKKFANLLELDPMPGKVFADHEEMSAQYRS